MASACAALAALHQAWAPLRINTTPCPAVARRLQALADWKAEFAGGPPQADDPARAANLRRGWLTVARLEGLAIQELSRWATEPVPVQPCLCDVHGEHVLFTGDAVTGLVDFGAVKVDHVAVDLARLLGDFTRNDDLFAFGLNAYRAAGGLIDRPLDYVQLLDWTGAVCGIVSWLFRLRSEALLSGGNTGIARLMRLIDRLEQIPGL